MPLEPCCASAAARSCCNRTRRSGKCYCVSLPSHWRMRIVCPGPRSLYPLRIQYPCGTAPSARLSRYCVHCTAAEAVSFDRISEAVFTNEHTRQLLVHFGSMIVGARCFPPNKLALQFFRREAIQIRCAVRSHAPQCTAQTQWAPLALPS